MSSFADAPFAGRSSRVNKNSSWSWIESSKWWKIYAPWMEITITPIPNLKVNPPCFRFHTHAFSRGGGNEYTSAFDSFDEAAEWCKLKVKEQLERDFAQAQKLNWSFPEEVAK